MIRALSNLAAVFALAVSAAPFAPAGTSKKPPPRGTTAHEYGQLTNYVINARAVGTQHFAPGTPVALR